MGIVVLPGDGIGPIVIEQALRVLRAVGFDRELLTMPFGLGAHQTHGDALPENTLRALLQHRVALLGAAATVPDPISPSPILRLRRQLGLELLVRPVWVEGERVTLVGHTWEGLYLQPELVVDDSVTLQRVVTAAGTQALLERACALARRKITFVDKPSVFRRTKELIERVASTLAFGGLAFEIVNADAFAAGFIKRPRDFDVVVAFSFVADVLSDLMAAVGGGIGLAPSAALGPAAAVFEPVHGTAPRRAHESPARVSPLGAIRAAAMLLEHVGEAERAARIERAIADPALPRTPDQGGAATTAEVGDAMIALVTKLTR